MCGIFGCITKDPDRFSPATFRRVMDDLFCLSESRGKEAAGIALRTGNAVYVRKQPVPASKMIQQKIYRSLFDPAGGEPGSGLAAIGHSRLVTDGSRERPENNQPVIKNNLIGIHNGIVVNVKELWARFPELSRGSELDTEIILGLLGYYLKQQPDMCRAARLTYEQIEGSASVALIFTDINGLVLATNTGSLYYVLDGKAAAMIFASEQFILKELLRRPWLKKDFDPGSIRQLSAQSACYLDFKDLKPQVFSIHDPASAVSVSQAQQALVIREVSPGQTTLRPVKEETAFKVEPSWIEHYEKTRQRVAVLKRCTCCLLPQTVPFIEFDPAGQCNYCREYRKTGVRGPDELRKVTDHFRRRDKGPDCLLALSGGRDSSYALHYLKRELGLNPIAFSYDWGMLTDLARRNQARMCGKLGVEHILVSADIVGKRSNIRKNVLAWLKKPDLGMVPLFMAGDKQYFYFAQKLKKQLGVSCLVMGENLLEETNFKTGFSGIKKENTSSHSYALSLKNRLKMAGYYAGQFLSNPAYLNSSLLDTLGAFFSYYFVNHEYINLYQYIPWDEAGVETLLKREYNWETAPDTRCTWRIGDGTVAFYNYIYYSLAGFTENDTFRSNQIREGVLTRQKALDLVEEENRPRYEAIAWYCRTIGIDFKETIERINNIPVL